MYLGAYVNAEEYKKEINLNHSFDFSSLGIRWDADGFLTAYRNSTTLYTQSDGDRLLSVITFDEKGLRFPEDYIINDYFTSKLSDRAYVFDNSYSSPKILARIEYDELVIDKDADYIPTWFSTYVLRKLNE